MMMDTQVARLTAEAAAKRVVQTQVSRTWAGEVKAYDTDSNVASVLLDGDVNPIDAVTVGEFQPSAGDRVLVLLTPRAAFVLGTMTASPAPVVTAASSADDGDGVFDEITVGGVLITGSTPGVPSALTTVPDALSEQSFVDVTWNNGNPPGYTFQVELAERVSPGVYKAPRQYAAVSTSLRVEGLVPLVVYGVRVCGINRIGVAGPFTAWGDFTAAKDLVAPPQITGLTVSRGPSSVLATWNLSTASDVANGHGTYVAQASTSSGFTSPDTKYTTGNILSFPGYNTEGTIYVRVAAIDSSGNQGPWSATASALAGGITGTMILEDAVGNLQLSNNSVNAANIVAGAVTTTQLAVNAVTATNIAAGAVTTDKLTVAQTGDNRILNGDFEGSTYTQAGTHTFPEAWGNLDTMAPGGQISTGTGANGVGTALRIDPASGAGNGLYVLSRGFPVVSGRTYVWSARYLAEATISSGIYLGVAVMASPGLYTTANPLQDTFVINNVGGTANIWNYAEGKFTATATGYLVVRPYAWEGTGGVPVRWDEITFREVERSVTIADGAIDAVNITADAIRTTHIKADNVVTAHMAANTINGDRILANSMIVEKLAAGTISSKTIIIGAGGQFQIGNAPSGVGMLFNSQGISLYNSAGTRTVYLDATTGTATFTGTVSGSTITGGSIVGATIETATSGLRVKLLTGANAAKVEWQTGDANQVLPAHLNLIQSSSGSSRYYTFELQPASVNETAPPKLQIFGGSQDGTSTGRGITIIADTPNTFNRIEIATVGASAGLHLRFGPFSLNTRMSLHDNLYQLICGGYEKIAVRNVPINGIQYSEIIFRDLPASSTDSLLRINANGSWQIYWDNSSERYKQDIVPLTDTYDPSVVVDSLTPITYREKTMEGVTKPHQYVGLSAERTHEVFPALVTLDKDQLPSGILYDKLSVLVLAEVKALRARVAELEAALG